MSGATPADVSRHRFTGFRLDVALAASVALVVVGGVWAEIAAWVGPLTGVAGAFPAGGYLLGIAASAVLIVRRTHSFTCAVVILVLVAAYHFGGYPGGAPALALFVALYSLAAYARSIGQLILAFVLVLVWAVIPALPPHPQPWDSYATLGPALGMIALVALGAAGRQVRLANVRSLAVAEAEAEARLRERLADERLGIARELHDVLAHTVSVISVQAAVAVDAFDTDPDAAHQAMVRVRALAAQAMPELRRTLTLLRRDTAEDGGGGAFPAAASSGPIDPEPSLPGPPLASLPEPPQPSLAELAELVDAARGPELSVALVDTTDHDRLGPLLEVTLYRIVQESLTNVIRHSGASNVTVTLESRDDTVQLRIADDGRGAPAAKRETTAGFGLTGMQERAKAFGGSLRTKTPGRADSSWSPSSRWLRRATRPEIGAYMTDVTEPIRVLLADDQPLIREGFRSILGRASDIQVVGEAADGVEAVERARLLRPDVVLMDIRMPRLDGIAATAQITRDPTLAGTRIVVVTTYELDSNVFDALRAGASGFLLKDLEADDLRRAVRVAAAGEALLAPSITRRLIAHFAAAPGDAGSPSAAPRAVPDDPVAGRLIERVTALTDREREVVGLVGAGLSNAEIATQLVISPATAKTHVSHAMIKAGARDRAQLVVFAYETGLVRGL